MKEELVVSSQHVETSTSEGLLSVLNEVIDLELSGGMLNKKSLGDALICIASNHNTPAELLVKLAKKKGASSKLLLAVVKNSNTTSEVFNSFSGDLSVSVRQELASVEGLPESLLVKLSGDVDCRVRNAVAENENTPVAILEMLRKDDSEFSNKRELVTDPCTHTAILWRFVDDQNLAIRQSLATHLNTSVSVLDYLIRDDSASVRAQVALNPNTSFSALEDLADDIDPYVQKAASSSINA